MGVRTVDIDSVDIDIDIDECTADVDDHSDIVRRLALEVWSGRVVLVALMAGLMLVGGSCRSGGSSDTVPKIYLSRDNNNLTPDVDLIQPESMNGAGQGVNVYDASYDLFDGALGVGSIGGTRTLGYYRGTPLVVNFFDSSCPPCVHEMPEFEAVFSSLNGEVAFLGLSQDRAAEDAIDLVKKTGVSYDVGWDPDLEVYRMTGSIAKPTTAFITAEGEMVDVFAGVLNQESLRERIAVITADSS